ncbi:hypothetical protein EON65_57275 [archaeon]|nr:MAG: hypothetical protein EON65_57275 [archaeon]
MTIRQRLVLSSEIFSLFSIMKLSAPAGIAGNIGLQSLLREPERLEHEAQRLNSELESLALENYKVFVESLTCSLHLQNEVSCFRILKSIYLSICASFQIRCTLFNAFVLCEKLLYGP